MAVLAYAEVTLVATVDVRAVTAYYRLVSSTAAAPTAPTAKYPASWTDTEPSYVGGSATTLYVCLRTDLSDGTWAWSAVSVSSSYEAAKAAWNKAQAAADAAEAATQHFWHDDTGAYVGTEDRDADTGGCARVSADGLTILRGGEEVASFGDGEVEFRLGGRTLLTLVADGGGAGPVLRAWSTGGASGDGGIAPQVSPQMTLSAGDTELVVADGALALTDGAAGTTRYVSLEGHSHAWERLGSCVGTGSVSYDLSGRVELLVAAQVVPGGSVAPKLVTTVIPAPLLTGAAQEVWVGGGRGQIQSAGVAASGMRALASMTATSLTGLESNDGPTVTTASTTWTVYAR